MNIALDLIAAAIIVASAVMGYKYGFIKTVMGFIKNLIASLAAFFLAAPLGDYLNTKFINSWFTSVVSKMVDRAPAHTVDADTQTLLNAMPDFFSSVIRKFGDGVMDVAAGAKAAVIDAVSTPASVLISRVVAFVIVYIVAFLLLTLVTVLLNKVMSFKILSGVNKLAGLAVGLLKGALLLAVLCIFVSYAMPMLGSLGLFSITPQAVDNSLLFRLCYNIIQDIVI